MPLDASGAAWAKRASRLKSSRNADGLAVVLSGDEEGGLTVRSKISSRAHLEDKLGAGVNRFNGSDGFLDCWKEEAKDGGLKNGGNLWLTVLGWWTGPLLLLLEEEEEEPFGHPFRVLGWLWFCGGNSDRLWGDCCGISRSWEKLPG